MNANEINKATIVEFYNEMLNKRQIDRIAEIVSPDYRNASGGGPETIPQGAKQLLQSFPDMQWQVLEIMAEDDKVMVKQRSAGTHHGIFQGHAPTGKPVAGEGFALYHLKEGKIVHHQVLTDRYRFLQQIGVIS